jgi:hypothetical protein
MIEVWTNRITMWRHETCRETGVAQPLFAYPESEHSGPDNCPLCGALLCGCCNVAHPVMTFTCDEMLKFVRPSGSRNYKLEGYP